MTNPPPHLVEIGSFFGEGYRPVLDFHGWRVAMLRFVDGLQPQAFRRVERHRETNEVFILTAGRADLVVCEGDAQPGEAFVTAMELNVAYNIGQAVWHNVVMSADAHIVLFERTDTTVDNSDYADLPADQIAAIATQFHVGRRQSP
jgi:ureidoglycolate hydrolase